MRPDEREFLARFIREHSGIVIGADKDYLLESRLLPVASKAGLAGLSMLIQRLRHAPPTAFIQEVIEAMTTNETLFFRDGHPFAALGEELLPKLAVSRPAGTPLQIWCAASSTGQEPYSIALAARDQVPRIMQSHGLRIFATDIDRTVLAKAKAALYSDMEVTRGLPRALLTRWFRREGGEWRLHEDIRGMVEFRHLNLLGPWGLANGIDVVFIRNVLIYFDNPTKNSIITKIAGLLAADGYLVLGGSESPPGLAERFERVDTRPGVYRKKC